MPKPNRKGSTVVAGSSSTKRNKTSAMSKPKLVAPSSSESSDEMDEEYEEVDSDFEAQAAAGGSKADAEEDEDASDSSENEDDDEESTEDQDDEEEEVKRTQIRSQLSHLTFLELEALKTKLGTKVYNEAMFGTKTQTTLGKSKKKLLKKFKRGNKNRPREVSSKIRSNKVREVVPVKRRRSVKDPRFQDQCGELKEEFWRKDYSFLRELAAEELTTMKEKFNTDKNMSDEDKERVREYLKRMANKERSDKEKEKLVNKRRAETQENKQRVKEGKNPYFMKKSTRKYVDLAEKYDKLKASGKLESYLKKKRKKNATRDKKVVNLDRS